LGTLAVLPHCHLRTAQGTLMANRDIVAIGTSAGGLGALRLLVSELPVQLPAALLVVMHLPRTGSSAIDSILNQLGKMPVRFAEEGEPARHGHVYLAPPDRHLLYDGHSLALGVGSRENYARPSIDPLFRSLAQCCAHRSIGVLMTGTLSDGTSGLHVLGKCGGKTVVQDPEDAAFPEMPATALQKGAVDHVATLAALPALLDDLVLQPAGTPAKAPEHLQYEVEMAKTGRSTIGLMDTIGRRSFISCPECDGVMWEFEEDGIKRYRCHIGHAFSTDLVNVALEESVSRALAVALRSFDERVEIARNLERQSEQKGRPASARMWQERIVELNAEAEVIRDAIGRISRLRRAERPSADR
jgi:two-component system, chemotaxis family, protein-glutamate methylesterase/glutaminase